jgi:hypothetical protein
MASLGVESSKKRLQILEMIMLPARPKAYSRQTLLSKSGEQSLAIFLLTGLLSAFKIFQHFSAAISRFDQKTQVSLIFVAALSRAQSIAADGN